MEKFCKPYISYWKSTFLLLVAIVLTLPSQALAQDVLVADKTVGVGVNEPDQQQFNANNLTLTNSGTIDLTVISGIDINTQTGITIINNSGGIIQSTGVRTISALAGTTNLTVTNSGTISSDANQAIRVANDSNFVLTNNAGGVISGLASAINMTGSGGTINNSGTITTTASTGQALQLSTGTGLTLNNNAGGVISGASIAVRFFDNNTITNSGMISSDTQSFSIRGNNNTITLKEGSILVGDIGVNAGLTGNILQIDQGFGQSYLYETVGAGALDLTLQDLSGNTVVQGSAGSVGQGANESIDELLGLRSFNLRSALKRYTDYSNIFGNNELYVEPFSFYSRRGTNSTVLGYETYGGGLNLIYPLKNRKTDLILSLGHSELDLVRGHDISRNNFLAGINSRDLGTIGKFKFSGFLVGGMEWHEGSREVFTNTTTTGKADITSDFTSYELITGGQFNYHHNNIAKTTWNTEVGFTFGSSFTPEYNERGFFAWGDRHLAQGSVHVSEQLITRINKKLAVRVGGEFEYRTVLTGRTQSYAINGTLVKSKSGNFNEKAVSVRVGTHYAMNDRSLAYVNMDGRISDNATRGTYGLSAGVKLNF